MHGRARLTSPRPPRPARRLAASAAAVVAPLAACTSAVPAEAGPFAADPLCAEVLVVVREGGYGELAGLPRRDTDAQSTAAWGDPPVVLRCGVEPLGPTTDPCLRVDGVDWVARESGGRTVLTTYGRFPAVEVSVPADQEVATDAVLAAVEPLVARLPQGRECL